MKKGKESSYSHLLIWVYWQVNFSAMNRLISCNQYTQSINNKAKYWQHVVRNLYIIQRYWLTISLSVTRIWWPTSESIIQVMPYLCFKFSGVIGQFNSVAIRLWVWTEYFRPGEYRMSYWGPGFLAVVWFCFSPTPPPSESCLPFPVFLFVVAGRAYWQERGEGVREEPNHKWQRESLVIYKSFNVLCSIFSVRYQLIQCHHRHTLLAPSNFRQLILTTPLW